MKSRKSDQKPDKKLEKYLKVRKLKKKHSEKATGVSNNE